ncbi:MAG: DUF1549 and DUF1553 domain-containing protein [Pirellulales bacterium]|nr:DUF1549 and DUF1553 domain-containing protein [Pirellulales bacterium]
MRWFQACLVGMLAGCVLSAAAGSEPYGRFQFEESDRDHWAFRKVERPEVPKPVDVAWVRTPIDAFVAAELQSQKLTTAAPADPLTLLRRAHLDLTGLPPTPVEQKAFLANPSPQRYAAVVDALLARPDYGERWGRHWLDVVRYAESNGYERDNLKPHAWRYRDYVIAAFNDDKPYDRFVMEQIAGDELADSNAETQIATTFLRLGPWDDEPADPIVDRYDQLDDVVGTTAATFLAITLRCARCHDHKFEPFSQRDYSRVLAVFEPLKRPQIGRDDLDRFVGRAEDLAQYRAAIAQADQVVSELSQRRDEIERQVRERLFNEGRTSLSPESVSAFQTPAKDRNEAQKKLVEEFQGKLAEEVNAACRPEERGEMDRCTAEIAVTNSHRPTEPPRGYVWYEDSPQAPLAHVFFRGDPRSPREAVEPGLPAVLVDAAPPLPTPTASSTGRRLQLAHWIASPDNPLTARVIVNRIWQGHFGQGICGTENDLGVMGDSLSHEELLDWLASEFVAGGWRIKPLHRLIMLSSAYQQSAVGQRPQAERIDPENRLLWHWRPRRLEAEAVRDCILLASGDLSLKRGGPSVMPRISEEVLAGQSRPGSGWAPSDLAEANRRSVYVFVKRTLPLPELEVLDFPNTNLSCEQRSVSTIAPQALTFLNGAFMQEQSRHFASRLQREAGPDLAAQLDLAFRLALSRPATADEVTEIRDFIARHARQIEADESATTAAQSAGKSRSASSDYERRALEAFCLVLLNSNEFVYLR